MQSFHAKKSKLEAFLSSLKHNFHSIVITETWNHVNNIDLCHLENFDAVHTFRANSLPSHGGIGGGVSIFANSNFYKIRKLSELSICNQHLETCVAEIFNPHTKYLYVVVGVYRPPSGIIRDFVDTLETILSHPTIQNYTVILTGDMNIDISSDNNNHSDDYLTALNSFGFYSKITLPTRFSNNFNSAATLDHIFLNKIKPTKGIVFAYDFSDHCGTSLFFETNEPRQNHGTKIFFRLCSDLNIASLEAAFTATNWDTLLNVNNPNIQFENFHDYINTLYCQKCPLKTKFVSEKKKNNPWVTANTLAKIRLKSELFKMAKNNEISWQENKMFKNRLNKEISRDKNTFYRNLFKNNQGNIKKSWSALKSLLGTDSCKKNRESIFQGAKDEHEKINILNKFNNFFASVGQSLSDKIPFSNISPTANIRPLTQSFYLSPVSEFEIKSIISNLKSTKTDIDEIPVFLFKKLSHVLSYPISKLINSSFESGIFPEKLKVARITPIHKNGDHSSPSNFRPISSLPYLSKIYEKANSTRLLSFCAKYSIISKNQFGFQPKSSTCNALLKLTETLYESLNNLDHNFTILIDIKKAFDCVIHFILLQILPVYGIRGVPLLWYTSYLSNRRCYLERDGFKSSTETFNVGVPQGSILGPLLFILYINSIPQISNLLNTILYADDTTISTSEKNLNNLISTTNNELEKLSQWMISRKLTLNAEKTEFLVFSNRITSSDNWPVLQLQGVNITPSTSCKYLGVHLDNRLSYKNHIQYVKSKISKHAGILFRIRDQLPISTRLNYYFAFMYPYINYNIIIWGSTYSSHLEPLVLQQKRIIRIIMDAGFRENTSPLFKRLNLLKIEDIYKYNLLIHMHGQISKGAFGPLHDINTRNRSEPQSVFHRLTLCQHSVSFMGPKLWGQLPANIKEIKNVHSFKRTLKRYVIDQY